MFDNKSMIRLYVPIFIEQGLATVITMLGTMMVSGVGAAAVSGVGLVDSINYLIISIFAAVATGVTVVVSQYIGAGSPALAGKAAGQSLVITVESAALLGALLIVFARPLLRALFGNAEREVLDSAQIYLIASSVSMPLQALYATAAGIMRATGNNRTPMYASLFADIGYVIVAYVCIYMLGMGVLGVGLGIAFSRIVSSGMSFYLLMKGHASLSIPRLSVKPDWSVLSPVLNIAVPTGADSALFNGGKIIVQVFMSGMGTAALAANSIGNALNNLVTLPGNALSILAMTIVGHCYGGGDMKNTQRYMNRLGIVSVGLITVSSGLMALAFGPMVGLFKPTPESLPIVQSVMTLTLATAPVSWATAFVVPNMLRATGDAKYPMLISILSMFLLRVAGAWFFGVHLGWGLFGIWLSMIADWFGRSLFFVPRMLSGGWKKASSRLVAQEAGNKTAG